MLVACVAGEKRPETWSTLPSDVADGSFVRDVVRDRCVNVYASVTCQVVALSTRFGCAVNNQHTV